MLESRPRIAYCLIFVAVALDWSVVVLSAGAIVGHPPPSVLGVCALVILMLYRLFLALAALTTAEASCACFSSERAPLSGRLRPAERRDANLEAVAADIVRPIVVSMRNVVLGMLAAVLANRHWITLWLFIFLVIIVIGGRVGALLRATRTSTIRADIRKRGVVVFSAAWRMSLCVRSLVCLGANSHAYGRRRESAASMKPRTLMSWRDFRRRDTNG